MITNEKPNNYYKNALSLAYLGDSVFTLMVRDFLVKKHELKPNSLNRLANSVVCARTQAEIMKSLKLNLNEIEMDIVMRARNSHTNNKAKNSTLEEYSLATQFEAIVGFWYLNNEQNKLSQMFEEYVLPRFS